MVAIRTTQRMAKDNTMLCLEYRARIEGVG